MKTVAIALALGDIYDERGLGHINKPLDGGIARFKTVTEWLLPKDSLVVCTAGYSKKNPTEQNEMRRMSLAGQLERYIIEYDQFWENNFVAKPLCWSTRNEVRVGIKLVQRIGFVKKSELANLIISSNFSHLIRIWLYTKMYTPKKWRVRLIWAHHQFSLMSHVIEIPKMIRDILYFIKVLYRLRSFNKFKTTLR